MKSILCPDYYASLGLPLDATDRLIVRTIHEDLAPAFRRSAVWKPLRHAFLKAVLDHHYIVQETAAPTTQTHH
jgi:hypothetical protein